MYHSQFSYSAGGVGRNICESLYKLGLPSNFLTVLGNDEQGNIARKSIPAACSDLLQVRKGSNTAQCIVVFNNVGDCKMLMGDMNIHTKITPDMIQSNEEIIKNSPLLILDGNLTKEALTEALKLAEKHRVPVFFEPTDIAVCTKPFETKFWKSIEFITPNLGELKEIAACLKVSSTKNSPNPVEEAAELGTKLVEYINNIIVTLGSDGIVIIRNGLAKDNFNKPYRSRQLYARHYPTAEIKDFVNVSGAGDCFASGFIAGMLAHKSEEICVSIGFATAKTALYSEAAVPKEIFNMNHESWKTPALYKTLKVPT